MAQDYNFTFQNLNTQPTGWTGNAIVNSPANQQALYDNPFDPVDPSQAVTDITANNPTGKGVEATSLKDADALLKRNAALIKNLERRAKMSESADMLNQANQELADAQKEQARLQQQYDSFKSSTKTPQQLRHEAQVAAAAAAQKATLTKQIENQHNNVLKQQTKLDAQQHSIDAIKAAITSAKDPKVIEHLNKTLASQQKTFSTKQAQLTAQNSHVTQLQTRLLALNPTTPTPGTTTTTPTPGSTTTTPAPGTTTPAPGTTPATPGTPAAPKQLNYWDELVDKQLGSRKGASGWHSAGGLPGTVPVITPPATPVTPVVTAPAVPGIPATPTTPAAPTPTRALTPQEIQWRKVFDPRGWANSGGIPTPVVTPTVPIPSKIFGGGAPTAAVTSATPWTAMSGWA